MSSLLILLCSGLSTAQAANGGVDVNRFHPALDAPGLVTTRSTVIAAPWTVGGSLYVHGSDDPLVMRDAATGEEIDGVVDTLVAGEASTWLNLPRVRLGLAVPVAIASGVESDRLLGDLDLELDGELVRLEDHGVGLGVFTGVRLPTGDADAWLGQQRASARGGLVGSAQALERVTIGAHAGVVSGGGATVDDWRWGPSLDLGLGTSVAIGPTVATSMELTATHVLSTAAEVASPAEAIAALHLTPLSDLVIVTGAGAGLTNGVGAPDWRLFAGLGWQPGPAERPTLEPVVQADPPTTGTISVRITDANGQPLPGQVVFDEAGQGTELTRDTVDGSVGEELPPGQWTVAVSSEGYRPSTAVAEVVPGSATVLTVSLAPWRIEVAADRLVLPERIHFAFDSAVIERDSTPMLQEIVELLQSRLELDRVAIMGHADETGSRTYNLDLSQRRAEAVRTWLVAHGIAPARLEAHAFGEEVPRLPGHGELAHAENRRVELLIVERSASL